MRSVLPAECSEHTATAWVTQQASILAWILKDQAPRSAILLR